MDTKFSTKDNAICNSKLVSKTQYCSDKKDLEKNIETIENKILDSSKLVANVKFNTNAKYLII